MSRNQKRINRLRSIFKPGTRQAGIPDQVAWLRAIDPAELDRLIDDPAELGRLWEEHMAANGLSNDRLLRAWRDYQEKSGISQAERDALWEECKSDPVSSQ